MLLQPPSDALRALKRVEIDCDFAVIGGGLSGVCAAVAAARAALTVTLLQDRPVLGGNASSEVRLWILGATSHMGNNNRWAREAGIVGEIVTENMHRNPEGNPVLIDALILEFVLNEPNIRLLLNTVVDQVERRGNRIQAVRGFCSQNSTEYKVRALYYCDASGDGVAGFLAGAAFRMGAEKPDAFGEGMAPPPEYGELLGHSIYFYSRDTGRPVRFTAPAFALGDIQRIPRYRKFNTKDHGCHLWWLEYGGRMDTVHDTETIKMELWKIVYGVWDYIKNSGRFPEAGTLTLEWVGAIPGKRESRRFEGDYMLSQRDVIGQRQHPDFVSYGGWSIDLHRADGIYSAESACNQYHAKGVYGIPYRCMYSRNIENLFLAGRIISASHVAFGSTRVMGTCGHNGQAVGVAAALCRQMGLMPRGLSTGAPLAELQRALVRRGQYIPGYRLYDPADIAPQASITATSTLALKRLVADAEPLSLEFPLGQMLPVAEGKMPSITFELESQLRAEVTVKLRLAAKPGNHTPEIDLAETRFTLQAGLNTIEARFDVTIDVAQYAFVCLYGGKDVRVRATHALVTGLTLTHHRFNPSVATSARQEALEGSGVDSFEFWCPQRRPLPQNLAFALSEPLEAFGVENLTNGVQRPVDRPNAWVAAFEDRKPRLQLNWDRPRKPAKLVLVFDADFDHPMESVLMGHPERDMPFCISSYRVLAADGRVLVEVTGNHHSLREHALPADLSTESLTIELEAPMENVPAALFEIRVYE